jgi:anti-sigma factor RsiW
MSTIGEHELQAYVDGELAPGDVVRVEAAIAADPAFAAQVERERRLRVQLRGAFDPVLDEPVPARFAALLQDGSDIANPGARGAAAARGDSNARIGDASVGDPDAAAGSDAMSRDAGAPRVPTLAPRGLRDAGVAEDAARGDGGGVDAADTVVPLRIRGGRPLRPRWHTPVYALAASLAVLAVSLWLRPGGGPVHMQGGELVARGELARGLDHALASEPAVDAALAIGLSFRDGEGRVCRSFVQRAGGELAGLACREGDRWTVPVLSRAGGSDEGELRQAASGIPPEVQAAVDARLQGDVFDAEAERAARDTGWH